MNPLLIILPMLLVIPAIYLLIKYRRQAKTSDMRTDETERRELAGPEQAKHRDQP